ETGENEGDLERAVAAVAATLEGLVQESFGVGALTHACVGSCDPRAGPRSTVVHCEHLLILGDGLGIHLLPGVRFRQGVMCQRKVGIELQSSFGRLGGLFVAASTG